MKVVMVTQAHMGTSRLPGKVLEEVNGETLLGIHLKRISRAGRVDKVILATTLDRRDDPVCEEAARHNVSCYRGKEYDVLDRCYQALKDEKADYIVGVTADCPLLDPAVIDDVIAFAVENGADYCTNAMRAFPDGQDVEVFTMAALETAWHEAFLDSDREHVGAFINRNSSLQDGVRFHGVHYGESGNHSDLRMTVDEPEDLELVSRLVEALGPDGGWRAYAEFIRSDDELRALNADSVKNAGFQNSLQGDGFSRYENSEAFLKKACQRIPLGSQTFSKSKTQLPHGVSPYFAHSADGAYFWDIDGNKYIDLVNGLSAITLGHNYPAVTEAVLEQVVKGTIFSLASPLEYEVAEQICQMVPCAEMVRFGKNGSDATAGAIRLARAYTGRDHVVVCGYHGWQDWYIGSTTRDLGVPAATKDLTHTFQFNNLASLEAVFRAKPGQIAAVIMEPATAVDPEDGFLEGVKTLTHENGALLIFDETVTGFRLANGGGQALFGVTPDLATFGKGLANGYPISAVAGRADVMRLMEEIFFSFTFGGETLSLVAAKATLTELTEKPVVETINASGARLKRGIADLIEQYELNDMFGVLGHPSRFLLVPKGRGNISEWDLKTLHMQEMFKNGVFSIGSHNLSYVLGDDDIDEILKQYRKFFEKVKVGVDNHNLNAFLACEPIVPLFSVRQSS